MNFARIEKTARRQADRLPARVSDLVDEGADRLRRTLDEAVDLIQGAAAQLAEEGESLIKTQVKRAAVLADEGAKQAKDASRRAAKAASHVAEESYADLTVLAGRNPLVVIAVAAGVGLTLGVGLTVGMMLRARRKADSEALDAIAPPAPAAKSAATPRARKAPFKSSPSHLPH